MTSFDFHDDAEKVERLRAQLAVRFPTVKVSGWHDWLFVEIQQGHAVRKTDVPREFEGAWVQLRRPGPSVRPFRKAPSPVPGGVDHDRDIRPRLLDLLRPCASWLREEFLPAGIVDVATVEDGLFCGYEIKAAKDSLSRLTRADGSQVDAYSAIFDRVTLVCAERHLSAASAIVPAWWGLLVAVPGALRVEREAVDNPTDTTPRMVQLLWQAEANALLRRHGRREAIKSWPARCEALAALPRTVVREAVFAALAKRAGGERSPVVATSEAA